ncbi:MAG: hypothetical protein LBH30_06065 [Prevotellaceae bacterium]|nr:hypothetical protein [Prevotellaceae bacterium]
MSTTALCANRSDTPEQIRLKSYGRKKMNVNNEKMKSTSLLGKEKLQ